MNLRHALPAALLFAALGANAAQTHQYRLDGSLSDDLGGPALTSHGGTLSATDYTFGKNQGLTLGASLGAVYTVDLSFHFDTHSSWQKIIDFSNLASDAGMYTLNSNYNFFPVTDAGLAPGDGIDGRLTLTRNAAALLSIYSNGALVGSFTDSSNFANFGANNANFFIDDFATGQGEAAAGAVDYIRTWDTALSADDVAHLAPPGVAGVPEPETYALMLAGLAALGFVSRRRKA